MSPAAIQSGIEAVEREISDQLGAQKSSTIRPFRISEDLVRRGSSRLVRRSETDATLKIRVLNVTRDELAKDLGSAAALLEGEPTEVEGCWTDRARGGGALCCPGFPQPQFHGRNGRHRACSGIWPRWPRRTQVLLIAAGSASLCGLARWSDLDDETELGRRSVRRTGSIRLGRTSGHPGPAESVVLPIAPRAGSTALRGGDVARPRSSRSRSLGTGRNREIRCRTTVCPG